MFSIKLVLTGIVSLLLVSCGGFSDLLKVANKLTEDAIAKTTFFQLNQNSLVVSNAEQSSFRRFIYYKRRTILGE